MEKKWRTAITQHVGHETYIRGYRLLDLGGQPKLCPSHLFDLEGRTAHREGIQDDGSYAGFGH